MDRLYTRILSRGSEAWEALVVAGLSFEYPDSELVIGLVAPVGTDLEGCSTFITHRLEAIGYGVETIHISALLGQFKNLETALKPKPEAARIQSYMDAGDEVRRKTGRGDFLALSASGVIARKRKTSGDGITAPRPKTAFILRSLKHPDEARTLRRIYGPGFFLLGVSATAAVRLRHLKERNMEDGVARRLIQRDEHADEVFGQHTRETFQLSDAFIPLGEGEGWKKEVSRVLSLIFGHPFETPTRDEHAMFLAYAASLRSADLSRQVGAVITNENKEVVATGANDVPAPGGGLYWPNESDTRDYKKGEDPNHSRRDKIVLKIMKKIGKTGRDEDLVSQGKELLAETGVLELTEFGRTVHAEMDALLSCARTGIKVRGGTLYSTTFPCHNCTKHVIAAGIGRVVFVEPYPKSLAKELHGDAITFDKATGPKDPLVRFEPFSGIGPRRYFDLFSMSLGAGRPKVRKSKKTGKVLAWKEAGALMRVSMLPTSYLEREQIALRDLVKLSKEVSNGTK